jgi:hypothetical protein
MYRISASFLMKLARMDLKKKWRDEAHQEEDHYAIKGTLPKNRVLYRRTVELGIITPIHLSFYYEQTVPVSLSQ